MIWRRILSAEAAFFLAVWLLVLVLYREQAFFDPGALWHIRVGELILADGFMRTDPFSYTRPDATWIPFWWVGELVMALTHRADGFDGLLLLLATGLAAVYAWLFGRLLAGGMGWPVAAAVAGLTFFVGSYHYFARPHMISIGLLAWTIGCVVDVDRGRAGPWRLAGLIPVFVLWTNGHAGVLTGILAVGLAGVGWLAAWRLGPGGPVTSPRAAVRTGAILLACGLTPLVNPFGLELFRTWGRLIGSDVVSRVIVEHMPLNPRDATGQVVLLMAAVYAIVVLGAVLPRPRSFRLTWLIPIVFFALAVKGIRHGPLFAVVAGVVLADVWPRTAYHRYLLGHGDLLARPPGPRPGWAGWLVPAVVVALAVGLHAGGARLPVVGRGWARIGPDAVPVDLTDAVRAGIRRAGPGGRMYNDANLGGYMIFFHPDQKVFMDDRCELYGDDMLLEYVRVVQRHPEGIEAWADEYGFDRALIETDAEKPSPLDTYLTNSPRWRLAPDGRGRKAVLFERVPASDR